ncbi:MAG: hypothetical protein AAF637_01405 [Pseudomonadota bacterium]
MKYFNRPAIRVAAILTVSAALIGVDPAAGFAQQDAAAKCNTDDSTAPCFAGVSDVLNGKRTLVQVDDLVVTRFRDGNPVDPILVQHTLEMDDSKISRVNQLDIDSTIPILETDVRFVAPLLGRMFDLPNDVVMTPYVSQDAVSLTVMDPGTGRGVSDGPSDSILTGNRMYAAGLADFTKDGFADVVVNVGDEGGTNSLELITANDVTDLTKKLFSGPATERKNPHFLDMVVGDLLGTGTPQVIGISAGGVGEINLDIHEYSSDEMTFSAATTLRIPVPEGRSFAVDEVTMTVGRFSDPDQDQLVIAYGSRTATTTAKVMTFEFDSGELKLRDTFDTGVAGPFAGEVVVRAGRFDPDGVFDQVAIKLNPDPDKFRHISLLTFDELLQATREAEVDINPITCSEGMEVGNFRGSQDETASFPELQLAFLGTAADGSRGSCEVYNVLYVYSVKATEPSSEDSETTWSIELASEELVVIPPGQPVGGPPQTLSVGDVQGRSIVVGAPEKVTVVAQTQPDLVIGMPPMHVDYIRGLDSESPSVFNVSSFPASINTQYKFADTSKSQAVHKSTTSYSLSARESLEEKVTYGEPALDSVTETASIAAKQAHSKRVARTYNTYTGRTFDVSAKTVFDDRVSRTIRTMNIFSYPVIGQSVCPAESPKCPDTCGPGVSSCPKLPLHIVFSGPDNVKHIVLAEASTQEWFQPVNQPGNLFSYPGSLDQLSQNLPQFPTAANGSSTSRIDLKTPANVFWGSQSEEATEVRWDQGGGSDVTSGTVNNFSFDSSVTVTGTVGITDLLGGSVTASLDLQASLAMSTLNTSTSSYDASQGVTVNLGFSGETSNTRELVYEGQTFIFGQKPPRGSIQDDIPRDEEVQSNGFFWVGFAANALSGTTTIPSGDWWRQAYTPHPDVALNHPSRWKLNSQTGDIDQLVMFNCPVNFSSSFDAPECVSKPTTGPLPKAAALRTFYQMKGLFITPGAATTGPTTTSTRLGDTLTLRARIYNYSMAEMPAGSRVHARFYAQRWDDKGGQFTSLPSDPNSFEPAIFIDEAVIDPIPPYCGGVTNGTDPCSDASAPRNWRFATVTWDTSKIATAPDEETHWKIWVVTWIDSGDLVPEIEGHGLRSVPAEDVNSFLDVEIENYSNNLGFYNAVITLTVPDPEPDDGDATARLIVDSLELSPEKLLKDEDVALRVGHLSHGARTESVHVLFYDGDPAEGGELFDVEQIPTIAANSTFVTPVVYRPRSCGPRELVIEAFAAGNGDVPTVRETLPVNVTVDPEQGLSNMIRVVETQKLRRPQERRLVRRLLYIQYLYKRGNQAFASYKLKEFADWLWHRPHPGIPTELTEALVAQADEIVDCLSWGDSRVGAG